MVVVANVNGSTTQYALVNHEKIQKKMWRFSISFARRSHYQFKKQMAESQQSRKWCAL